MCPQLTLEAFDVLMGSFDLHFNATLGVADIADKRQLSRESGDRRAKTYSLYATGEEQSCRGSTS